MSQFVYLLLFFFIVSVIQATRSDEEVADQWLRRRSSNIHFDSSQPSGVHFDDQLGDGVADSTSFRYPRQLSQYSPPADQDDHHPEAQDDSYYYQSDQPSSYPIANLARGSSSSGDTFHLSSASSGGSGATRPTWSQTSHRPSGGKRKYTSGSSDSSAGAQMNFGAMLARSRRSAPPYHYPPAGPKYGKNYEEEQCQYHTLINGDSEIIMRKLLPFRMVGRTILRHCIKPPPRPDDPRYKTLLRGNNKSSFGNVRVSMKM